MLDPMPDPDDCFDCKALREENARLKDLAADAEAGAKENAALLELSYRKRDSLTRERDAALTHGPEDMVRALEELTRERDDARAELAPMSCHHAKWCDDDGRCTVCTLHANLAEEEAEISRLEGLILDWGAEIGRPEGPAWAKLEAEARRIRAQREEER